MIIGLTGMSGAGKSTAAKELAKRGFKVIDCDTIARQTITRSPCVDEVKAVFPEVFTKSIDTVEHGIRAEVLRFDRKIAANVLFSNPGKLEQYQKIVFPYVVYSIIKTMNNTDFFLLDAPTLYQSGLDDFCDMIIAVVAAQYICVKRITERDNISEKNALMRLENQYGKDFFKRNADCVIENNGNLEEFIGAINQLEII